MGRRRMIDNKDSHILTACKSEYACGNYFYGPDHDECERCRTKEMC